jgi:uncharacterized protein (TIGR03067 family)
MLRLTVCAVLILALPIAAAPIPKSLKKKPNGTIIGTWRVSDSQTETWIFREDGTAGYGHSATEFSGKAVFTFDESVNPHEISWTQDGNAGVNLGIYLFEDDQLKMNFSAPGKERMKNLTDQGGARQVNFRRLSE